MKTVTTLAILLVIALSAEVSLRAQSNKYKNITENSIETLKQGIKSDNTGLRKSSIYMAGFYKIDEAVDILTGQLLVEKDPGIKILIALSLYNIGNPEGVEAIRKLAVKDSNSEVRRMSTILYKEYIAEE